MLCAKWALLAVLTGARLFPAAQSPVLHSRRTAITSSRCLQETSFHKHLQGVDRPAHLAATPLLFL